ncbi:hypothetical protein MPSEU_000160200 [Mayamaea pseudoterrestris]|nr:hypothetical protein MPSEU_000160200 [Mayamaea pseudoterrestris]
MTAHDNDSTIHDNTDADEQTRLDEWRRKRAKRKAQQQEESNDFSLEHESRADDDSTTVVTAAKRRQQEEEAFLKQHQNQTSFVSQRRRQAMEQIMGHDDGERRNERATHDENDQSQQGEANNNGIDNNNTPKVISLLEQAAALQQTAAEREQQQRRDEEQRILREASQVQTNALQAASEIASGMVYAKPMPSTWTAPSWILKEGPEAWEAMRKEWHMLVQGNDVPPPVKRFVDLKLPAPILHYLQVEKNIQRPTPIQMQGLSVALAGRDMVGIAFTGSGKTLAFSLPLIMAALEEELRMPLVAGEGPIGIILAPSRELARQTFDLIVELANALQHGKGQHQQHTYPQLRAQLLIGGESLHDQLKVVKERGIHAICATPGRLRDVLKRKAVTLQNCRYICLDEADRMLSDGFDEEVGEIMNYFPHQRQTLLYSATFPAKFQAFAKETLVQPIVVNVGRAGAANLDVIQEVEYVKEEAKIVYLLHCLQKTAPPVIIFCERKGAADDIHEYLLLKGVDAVSIHGGKDQEERNEAINLFKSGKKDVLIATDIAAKGLDFPDIQHVINFDMPEEIENYVHRIGRTGRCGKTGVATTFINKSCSETTLLDLKGLLREARQRIPPVLQMLDDPRDENGGAGCSFCGGLGHTIVDCPKIDKDARRVAGNKRDVLSGGGDW